MEEDNKKIARICGWQGELAERVQFLDGLVAMVERYEAEFYRAREQSIELEFAVKMEQMGLG